MIIIDKIKSLPNSWEIFCYSYRMLDTVRMRLLTSKHPLWKTVGRQFFEFQESLRKFENG